MSDLRVKLSDKKIFITKLASDRRTAHDTRRSAKITGLQSCNFIFVLLNIVTISSKYKDTEDNMNLDIFLFTNYQAFLAH